MIIKNVELVKDKIREHLQDYLEEMGLEFNKSHFQCPNFSVHKHDDMKPAASFYPDKQHWKCFVCEKAGDIFTAATCIEGKPSSGPEFLTDNLIYLANRYKVKYEIIEDNKINKKYKVLYEALEYANKLMKFAIRQESPVTKAVQGYINDRNWNDLYDKFEFGYCRYDKLIQKLREKGITDEILKQAGLGIENKALLDNRLVFPIKNPYNRIIGFASRTLADKRRGEKYLNSSTTLLYKKSDTFFNLNNARKNQKVYIVEGYGDVFTMNLNKIENVVALCDLSFNFNRYTLLAENGVKEIVFCLDSDDAGKNALYRILKNNFIRRIDLKVKVKILDGAKDPDEFIKKFGIEKFLKVKETNLFDYFLSVYQNNSIDENLNDLFKLIIAEGSFIKKEKNAMSLAEHLGIKLETLYNEIHKYESETKLLQEIKSSDILREKASFTSEIEKFEDWSWHRGKMLGLSSGFPIMDSKMDGIQNGFYLIAGKPNVGKTAFCLSLGFNVIKANINKVFVLYFSIDDNLRKVIPRLLANESNIEINMIANPKSRIIESENLNDSEKESLLKERGDALVKLKGLSSNFVVKDASYGVSVEYMEKIIQVYKLLSKGLQLVVFIDNFHKMDTSTKRDGARDKFTYISKELKRICNVYDVPIIAVCELRKSKDVSEKPDTEAIKETVDLSYDSDAIFLLYNDLYNNPDKSKLKFNYKGRWKPVIELRVAKNKTSGFKNYLFYKFLPELSKVIECTKDEMENLRRRD